MTCVVGLRTEEGVILGADSASGNDWRMVATDRPKIFEVGEYAIGVAGSWEFARILEYDLVLNLRPSVDTEVAPDYVMQTTFVRALRTVIDDALGGRACDQRFENIRAGEGLVAFRGELFHVTAADLQIVTPACGYMAIGSGVDVALGAMAATADLHLAPKARVGLALEAAAEHARGVRRPFVVRCFE